LKFSAACREEGGEEMEENKGVNFILGLFVGALVGAAIAILMTPQSGPQVREQLKERTEEMKKKAEKWSKDFKEDAEEWLDKTHHMIDDKAKNFKETITKKKMDDVAKAEEEGPKEG